MSPRIAAPAPPAPSLFDMLSEGTRMDAAFAAFDADNPKVYAELVALVRTAHAAGRAKVGIKMLFEVVRWNRYLATDDPEFKLNNNYTSRYARKIMAEHPQFAGMFDLRELRS